MKRCLIFAAGTFYGLVQRPEQGDLIIAADAGYRICRQEGIVPSLLLGDFDSMDAPADFLSVCRLPVEKDDTDTLAAIRYGLEQGCTEFHIYGGTGGRRLDHTLANLQALLFLRRHNARGWLYDDAFVWTAMENETLAVPCAVEWGLLSLFCLDGRAEGVSVTGVQYPLSDGVLTSDFPLGVSNHILADEAMISVRSGALVVGWQTADVL
ncbi:MAG: thiamine diphosphokinase [Ruminococcaceae bacterium]|nr:thiamine diphosphokinase [Oscillospiraceae bacterium]